jgi:hypothetical protein
VTALVVWAFLGFGVSQCSTREERACVSHGSINDRLVELMVSTLCLLMSITDNTERSMRNIDQRYPRTLTFACLGVQVQVGGLDSYGVKFICLSNRARRKEP